MPYDWRREQEEAGRRRARDAEIAAQQAAHNRKLEENSRKAMNFWADKMQKEQQRESDRVTEKRRARSSSGPNLGTGSLWVDKPLPGTFDAFPNYYDGHGSVPQKPKKNFFDSLAEASAAVAQSLPPTRWLLKFGEKVMHLPGKYSAHLAWIGAVTGLFYGLIFDRAHLLRATFIGTIAGGILLPGFGFAVQFLTLLMGMTLIIALVVGVIALAIALLNKFGH
jgi:hypothetical protein